MARGLADPRHRDGSEMPLRCTRDARQLLIPILMTGPTLLARDSVVARPANDRRVMQLHRHALVRRVSIRMAVDASRMHQHARHLAKQRARSSAAVPDGAELGHLPQLVRANRAER